jgi:hypothetical protein
MSSRLALIVPVLLLLLFSVLTFSLRCSLKSMAAPKLRILCLHGKQQNREIFRAKLGKIPRKLKDIAEMIVVDAPYILEDLSTPEVSARTWFYREVNGGPIEVSSLRDALKGLETTWREQGPFDGILGFSMGGTMASIMASANLAEVTADEVGGNGDDVGSKSLLFPGLRFVICAGAVDIPKEFSDVLDLSDLPVKFPLRVPEYVRSLHIAGTADTSVPIASSIALAGRFTDSRFIEHDQGHHIPMKTPIIQAIEEFVSQQRT